ncbi:MAG: valine--tRNA ligase [Endomicrobium sp.]|jgi:valyl-tRNA synthetase|nr:valine--tRNA ligase [Endomicrobium sp.]
MEKIFNFRAIEKKWCEYWVKNKTFYAKVDDNKKPFVILIPPANVTGSLHMGHALNVVLQDILIRFKKLQGYNTLWVPGIDHGGIATQNVVEKLIKKEGETKNSLGRTNFLKKTWQWKNEVSNKILDQLKVIGCALDWDRIVFTMDKKYSRSVKKAFIWLFNKGLIYRKKRLVNWCYKCGTVLSDMEIEYESERSSLWYIKYPLKDSTNNEYVTVATTRPETIFGDVAVAVNPTDERYINLINKIVNLPLTKRELKVISDYIVDKSFGSGVIKVTPAHDIIDNEIANRNNLETIETIDINAKIINASEEYNGLNIEVARKKIVLKLKEKGFLIKTEDYVHSVGKCYRCSSKIEFLMSEQWFLKVKEISKKAIDVVSEGKIVFHPKSWGKSYNLWLKNIKDWCISRQIWWGHRIPVYYCIDNNGHRTNCIPIVSYNKPKSCIYCKNKNFVQDKDVLDTWFSSALWPIGVFNWGDNKNNFDLEYFYPTSVLVTGYEIIYLWVVRMIQFGLEFTGKIPYADIFIHGIVRDKFGKKMSKSLGNVVDPIKIIEKYGTDSLRFALAQSAVPGRDIQISDEAFLISRNFINKIWNASRFIIMNITDIDIVKNCIHSLDFIDEWIILELENTVSKVKYAYESYSINIVTREIYDFFWSKYCNWYIEFSKIRMMVNSVETKKRILSILIYIFKYILQLMYPITPFITSEILQILNQKIKIVSKNNFCLIKNKNIKKNDIVNKMLNIQDIIVKIRAFRNEMNISSKIQIEAIFNVLDDNNILEIIKENKKYIKYFTNINLIKFGKNITKPKNSVSIVTKTYEIFLVLGDFINIEKEKKDF